MFYTYRYTIYIVLVILAANFASTSKADNDNDNGDDSTTRRIEQFVSIYKPLVALLHERYSSYRKIRFRYIEYDDSSNNNVKYNALCEQILDDKQMKNIVLECTPNDKKAAVVEFWRIDMRFNVEPVNGGYQIKNQHLASANYQLHEGVRNRFFSSFPLSASDGSTREWFDNRGHGSAIYRIADVKNSEWKNRPCIEVRSEWDNKHGIVNYGSTFLDPDHDYITIGSEGDWTVDPINKYRRKVYQEIEYSPSTDGYLLPKSARRYIRKENGPEIKIYDIDFLSYERYFPSEDEFKLEGPYKLTTPAFMPVSSNPALETTPARRARWPWILFAIAAILAIPSVYYLWRSRKASRQITGSQIMKLDKK